MLQSTVDELAAKGVAQESEGCMCVFVEVRQRPKVAAVSGGGEQVCGVHG